MEAFMEECEHLKHLNLKEIKSIMGDFDKNNIIGEGGFGKVYKGVLSHSSGAQIRAAFKRLDSKFGQGNPEFLKEIFMLSRYTHENLISLLGFCDEDGEKILAYEHASHGSLDRHLSSTTLSWTQRLEICLGAARGLCYLHDPKDTQQRVIHRDIKSSNILLDENWNAKVSDMGLSKIGPANQPHTFLATNVVGTFCYIDPMYMETNILTKESDVYSFGVVLFEVLLCGSLCFEHNNNHFQSLVPMWKKSYKQKRLDEIIFQDLKQEMDHRSLETFSEIAYLCLQKSRAQRPKMSDVIEKLEIALRFQKKIPQIVEFEEMVKTAAVNKEELEMLHSKGILLDDGNTWLSLNKYGEHLEMISAECFIPTSVGNLRGYVSYGGENKSRFEVCKRRGLYERFKTHVRAQYLSPNIAYTVNLVFKYYEYKRTDFLGLWYTLGGETKNLISFVARERGDGWLMAELYQVISNTRYIDLEISFRCPNLIEVEGIEFRPMEMICWRMRRWICSHTVPDTYWGQKLPLDYAVIIKRSKDHLQWTTKKELYSILRKGLPLADGAEWFSLTKDGKNCHMLSARLAFGYAYWRWEWPSLPQSRFKQVASVPDASFEIDCQSDMLSPETTYATYLVYKIQENHSRFDTPLEVCMSSDSSYSNNSWYIHLLNPRTPLIKGMVYQKKGLPQPSRNNDWMEVQIWEFQTDTTTRKFSVNLRLRHSNDKPLKGLIVEGVEFRPIWFSPLYWKKN